MNMSMRAIYAALLAGFNTDKGELILLLALEKLLGLGMQGAQGLLPGEIHWQTTLLGRGSGHLQAFAYSHLSSASN